MLCHLALFIIFYIFFMSKAHYGLQPQYIVNTDKRKRNEKNIYHMLYTLWYIPCYINDYDQHPQHITKLYCEHNIFRNYETRQK